MNTRIGRVVLFSWAIMWGLAPTMATAALVASMTVDYGPIDDGRYRYEYSLVNEADSEFPLDVFLLDVGRGVELSDFSAPVGWLVDFAPEEDPYELLFQASAEDALQPGERGFFSFLTPALPADLSFFVANLAESQNEGGYVLDVIASPGMPFALRPGDTNEDNIVDITDLNNVRNHFADVGEPVLGDTEPFDGIVDLYDLNQVRNNFGRQYGLPAPEPGAAFLAIASACCGLLAHRRRYSDDGSVGSGSV